MTKLVIVTILLAVLAVVLRKRTSPGTRMTAIKVTARSSMHRGVTLAVIEVDGRRLLVGAGSQSVNLIADLSDGDTAETPRAITALATEVTDTIAPASLTPVTAPVTGPVPAARTTVLDDSPASMVDRLRRATTRTADPVVRSTAVRHPRRSAGAPR